MAFYDEQIVQYADRLSHLKQVLIETETHQQQSMNNTAITAFEDLKTLTLNNFWKLGENENNRLLHRMFGQWKVVVRDKQCIGLAKPKTTWRS